MTTEAVVYQGYDQYGRPYTREIIQEPLFGAPPVVVMGGGGYGGMVLGENMMLQQQNMMLQQEVMMQQQQMMFQEDMMLMPNGMGETVQVYNYNNY